MLITKSDQEIARQNYGVSYGVFVCYYVKKILNNSSLLPPNFTIHNFRLAIYDTLCPGQRNMSNVNVSSSSSSIVNLSANISAKRGRKRKCDIEKADYKKRHITYTKKRNEKP